MSRGALHELVRERAWSALACGGTAVALLVPSWDLSLASFEGRPISAATSAGTSVGARLALYAASIVAFVAAGLAGALVTRSLARRLGGAVGAALEHAAFAGVFLLALLVCRTEVVTLAWCLVAGVAALVANALVDRFVLRREVHADRGRLAALEATAGFAVGVPLALGSDDPTRVLSLTTAVGAIGAHALLQWCARNRATSAGSARSERASRALACIAAIPLALVLAREAALAANAHGASEAAARAAALAVWLALGAWCVVRAREKAPALDLERELATRAVPLLLAGLFALSRWQLVQEAPLDVFEPANAAITLQELFARGRLPIVDTFDAHLLSGHLAGAAYSSVFGFDRDGWFAWDWVPNLAGFLCAYHVLRRAAASGVFAGWVALGAFSWRELFPDAFAIVLIAAFALDRALCLRTTKAWALAFACVPLACAWRLDAGVGAAFAALATWGAARWIDRASTPTLARSAGIAALLVGGCGLAFVLACAARGVAPLERWRDLAALAESNAAFARASIAARVDHVVLARTFAIPALVLAAAIALVARARALGENPRAITLSVWIAAFTLAVLPRSLERHTHEEGLGAFVSVFSLGFVALMPLWFGGASAAMRAATAGLALALPLLVPMDTGRRAPAGNLVARATRQLGLHDGLVLDRGRVERSVRRASDETRRVDRVVDFLRANLAPGETFLDLSCSPMLYVRAELEPPHWVNHTLLAQGESLQRSFLRDLGRRDVPLVVLRVDRDLVEEQRASGQSELDGIDLSLRQYRIFEHVYATCEPLAQVERWQIWARRGFVPRVSPTDVERSTLAHDLARPRELRLGALARAWATTLQPARAVRDLAFAPALGEHAVRADFAPLAPADTVAHLVLDVGAEPGAGREAVVRYGDASGELGAFRFDVALGTRALHAIRPSSQWSWWSGRATWIALEGRGLVVHAARIEAGD